MTLYLYRVGTSIPVLTMEQVADYSANHVTLADGSVYSPLADDCELSSLADCSETLREAWRESHPSDETRIEELEALVAALLYGGEIV